MVEVIGENVSTAIIGDISLEQAAKKIAAELDEGNPVVIKGFPPQRSNGAGEEGG